MGQAAACVFPFGRGAHSASSSASRAYALPASCIVAVVATPLFAARRSIRHMLNLFISLEDVLQRLPSAVVHTLRTREIMVQSEAG